MKHVTLTDRSGTLAQANVAQEVLAVSSTRQYLEIVNLSAGDIWYSFTGAAAIDTPGSFPLGPKDILSYPDPGGIIPVQALSIIGAVAGQAYSLVEG